MAGDGEMMIGYEFMGVEIDRFMESGAIWLDDGELDQICRLGDVDSAPLLEAIDRAPVVRHNSRPCPRCRGKLNERAVSNAPALNIERCPKCYGLLFERGEMRRLITDFLEGDAAVVSRFFADLFQCDQPNMNEEDS